MSLTFLTSCNQAYEPFAVPYAVSALVHNDDAVVEICVENPELFQIRNRSTLALINTHFPDRLVFRGGCFAQRLTNSVRFLESPQLRSEYTYIGDIDILILERDISHMHLAHMRKTGLPYSNVLRPGTQRLTGLHFTKSDVHYPLEIPPDFDTHGNDEHLLYRLVVGKGLPLPDPADRYRPGHGFHISLNRVPTRVQDKPHWDLSPQYLNAYQALVNSPIWQELVPCFSPAFRMALLVLDGVLQAQHPDRAIFKPQETKRLFSMFANVHVDTPISEVERRRSELVKERRFSDAIELLAGAIATSPGSARLYYQMAWLQAAVHDLDAAVAYAQMARQLAPNDKRFIQAAEKYRTAWERSRSTSSPTTGKTTK